MPLVVNRLAILRYVSLGITRKIIIIIIIIIINMTVLMTMKW
jgi:hypothetical protein